MPGCLWLSDQTSTQMKHTQINLTGDQGAPRDYASARLQCVVRHPDLPSRSIIYLRPTAGQFLSGKMIALLRYLFGAPDKCGALPALAGKRPQTADSASSGFVRHIPHLPVTPAVGAPSEAWRFLQGERPCRIRPNQPIVPSVAVMKEAAKIGLRSYRQ